MTDGIHLRRATRADAATIAALSIQVFLDTYATEGVRPDLAREALGRCSEAAFAERLSESSRRFVLAETANALVGFAELLCGVRPAPIEGVLGSELVRLYVQPQAQGTGSGSVLLQEAEAIALASQASHLWLTAWEHNERALAFYARKGYADVGGTTHAFEGRTYGNRVLAKPCRS